ncbi:hypothetical protein F4810DRAFT_709130 [Camillea tinctor]|nr:hypothetical protein F4810DRAFT_709130 [Camillea tinctor]
MRRAGPTLATLSVRGVSGGPTEQLIERMEARQALVGAHHPAYPSARNKIAQDQKVSDMPWFGQTSGLSVSYKGKTREHSREAFASGRDAATLLHTMETLKILRRANTPMYATWKVLALAQRQVI